MGANISLYKRKDFAVTDMSIQSLAERYLQVRTSSEDTQGAILLANNPIFTTLEGFDPSVILEIIKQNAKPQRIAEEKRRPLNDIYRSDLGELLMVNYFEKECADKDEELFIIPIKNLFDRELDNQPGRGYDVIGYRKSYDGKIILLLGEAKVSEQKKGPPDVVDVTPDSMYSNHFKSKSDIKFVEKRIANLVKKVSAKHKAILALLLFWISTEKNDVFEIVYGCCLVRDHTCIDEGDYGKMKAEADLFLPGTVNFIIYCFDKEISEVVDLFHSKIIAA